MKQDIIFKKIIAMLNVFIKKNINFYLCVNANNKENKRYIGLSIVKGTPIFIFTEIEPNPDDEFDSVFSELAIVPFKDFLKSISSNSLIIEDQIGYTHQVYKENEIKLVKNLYIENFYNIFQIYKKKDPLFFEKRFLSFLVRWYKKYYNM